MIYRKLISSGNPFEASIGFSRAVKVGPFITVSGTAPIDKNGKTVGLGDPAAQTKQCLEIIKDTLEKAGSGLHHVVRTRTMVTRIEDWQEVVKVRAEYFKDIRPAETIMQVNSFINPEWLIEIEVDAIISNEKRIT